MNLFDSIFAQGEMNEVGFFISIISALIIGVLFALVCSYKSNSSKTSWIE